jgi:hypothetical protein
MADANDKEDSVGQLAAAVFSPMVRGGNVKE